MLAGVLRLGRFTHVVPYSAMTGFLSGVSEQVYDQLVRTGKLRLTGPVRVYGATEVIGAASREAVRDAEAWLAGGEDAPELRGGAP